MPSLNRKMLQTADRQLGIAGIREMGGTDSVSQLEGNQICLQASSELFFFFFFLKVTYLACWVEQFYQSQRKNIHSEQEQFTQTSSVCKAHFWKVLLQHFPFQLLLMGLVSQPRKNRNGKYIHGFEKEVVLPTLKVLPNTLIWQTPLCLWVLVQVLRPRPHVRGYFFSFFFFTTQFFLCFVQIFRSVKVELWENFFSPLLIRIFFFLHESW